MNKIINDALVNNGLFINDFQEKITNEGILVALDPIARFDQIGLNSLEQISDCKHAFVINYTVDVNLQLPHLALLNRPITLADTKHNGSNISYILNGGGESSDGRNRVDHGFFLLSVFQHDYRITPSLTSGALHIAMK